MVDVSSTVHCSYAFALYNDSITTWKSDFTKKAANFTKKRWISCVCYHYLYSGVELLAAHSQTILFTLNISDIKRQNMWKIKLTCHLKHSLGLQKKRFTNPPTWLINFLHIFWESAAISFHMQKLQLFPQETFIEPNSTDCSCS